MDVKIVTQRVKCKAVPVQVEWEYKGSGGIAPVIHNLGYIWK
jgi:hypothetical protein